jgi:hypothetical protein
MRKVLFAAACLGLLVLPAYAGDSAASTANLTNTDGNADSGWVVSNPAGSSDYFNTRYDNGPGHGSIVGFSVVGVSLASADFGSGASYPTAGSFDANLGVDPSGNTPDLGSGSSATNVPGSGIVFNWVYANIPNIVVASAPVHGVVQFPPGDPGLLGIMVDTQPAGVNNFSGFTTDGYATPAVDGTGIGDMGMNLNIDLSAVNTHPHILLSTRFTDEVGDFATVTTQAGKELGAAFFATAPNAKWMMFLSFLGTPIKPVTGPLPVIPDGGGGYLRAGTTWPAGFGGLTLNFVAVSGIPGSKGSVQVSNEVTIITLDDPNTSWGIYDDCTYEGGWVVSIPSGSSDYFNVNFQGSGTPPASITDIQVAVMDFGSAATAYPNSGAVGANLGLDGSGNTPDLGNPYDTAPLPYAAGLFATTCGQMTVRTFVPAVPYGSVTSDNVHGIIQFPAGDPGLLGVGGDTISTFISGNSGWTLDGYTSPSNLVGYANWGIRLGS